MLMKTVIVAIICYLIGSVSPGIIMTKIKGKGDIRKYGSGGTGATNVNRTLGTTYGVLVMVFDCLKALIPLLIIKFFFAGYDDIFYISAVAIILGHCYPVYYKFKGGKGVSSAMGVLFATNWWITLILLAIFALVVWIFRYISLGSIIAAISFPFLCITQKDKELCLFAMLIALIIIWKHKANIMRLISKSENKFSFSK